MRDVSHLFGKLCDDLLQSLIKLLLCVLLLFLEGLSDRGVRVAPPVKHTVNLCGRQQKQVTLIPITSQVGPLHNDTMDLLP